jgi:hypothetical protein
MLSDGNKLIQKLVKGDLKDAGAPAWKLTKAVAQFFGASLGNVEKFVKMIANNIEDAKNGDWGTFEAGVDRTKAQNTHLLFDALQAGDTARADRLKENFKDEKDVRASLKSYIKELYTGEDQQILKDETIKLLQQYCGMTRRDAESTAQEWTMEIRTGIKYSDLNSEFIEGNVDRAHAIKYLQDYKSMTRAEAEAKVLEWQCEKDTGIAFADIGTEVKTGRLGKTKALSMLMKYGGKSEEAADKQVEGWLIEHEYNIRPSELQEEYMDGNVSVEDAFDILVRYQYNGKEDAEEKAYNELVRWNFIEENPAPRTSRSRRSSGTRTPDLRASWTARAISTPTKRRASCTAWTPMETARPTATRAWISSSPISTAWISQASRRPRLRWLSASTRSRSGTAHPGTSADKTGRTQKKSASFLHFL